MKRESVQNVQQEDPEESASIVIRHIENPVECVIRRHTNETAG